MLSKDHKTDIFVYENILNTFYRYYSNLREDIWHKLTKLNQTKAPTNAKANNTTHTYGKNFYLYKAQKLIDRIIFIRFCKEKGALEAECIDSYFFNLQNITNKKHEANNNPPPEGGSKALLLGRGQKYSVACEPCYKNKKYQSLKALFTAMNEGNTELGISKFNGGLFAEDRDLDGLVVDDEIIDRLVDFYSHDFGSELDVNILGHIFEQSISDLETLTGDNQAKRKKDGVFYTPAYISDYLVHDTINLWVNDKRKALGIKPKPEVKPQDFIDEKEWIRLQSLGVLTMPRDEYLKQRAIELKGYVEEQELSAIIYPTSKKHKELQEEKKQEAIKIKAWQDYAEALKTIKVLDPSCGSGAFLVKVFDYLQNEWIEVEKHIKTDKTDYTYKDILKNNIYGVDLNPVSAGITKLSLWLKTAHHKEPLTSLDKNIKVGNSLIDNPDIAGYYSEFEGKVIQEAIERDIFNQEELDNLTKEGLKKSLAFNWQEEFESVFKPQGIILGYNDPKTQAKIGFDIILGNPPYVRQELFKDIKTELEAKYQNIYNGAADLYCYFYEQATNLLKPQGYLGFITSNKWMRASYGQGLRDYLFANTKIINFIDLGGQKVFDNASVDCNMIVYQKKPASRQMVSKGDKDNVSNINNEDNIYNVSNVGNQYNADNVSNINNEDNFDDYFFKASTNLISYRLFHIKNLDPKCFNITATDIDRQIKAKMEQIGTPLKEWGVKINAGIKTGCNEAFIINTKTKEELCKKDPKCEDIIKPILRGRDIDRYGYEWAGLWLINTHNGYKKQSTNTNNPPPEGGSKFFRTSGRGDFYNNHADRNNDKNSSNDLKMTQNNPPLEGGSKFFRTSGRGYNIENLRHAKQMRKEMTKAELALWKAIKANQLGYKFRRQHPVGNFITDFCCLEKGLVIELDGSQHTEQQEYDNQRTEFLNSAGFKVIRFWNNEFLQYFNDCIDYIVSILNDNTTPPQSSYGALTLPQGEGCFEPTEQERIERINVEKDYPAIYEHLLKYKDQLEKRTDKGDHWTNLRDCAYYGDFDNSRLIWQEIVYNSSFCYTEDIIYPEATTFVMTGKNLKYLLVLLNSKPCTWAFKTFYAGGGLGSKGFRYKKMFLEKLPIPQIPQDAQKPFEEKAEAMLKLNKELKTHSTQMVEFLVDKFLPYHKPKSKKQALEEFEALKTDTDYNKSIPEINRVANHNNSLAKKLNKDMQGELSEEDIYKLKSKLSKWYEAGFNLASVFEVLQKFNITVPSKEQFTFSLEFNDTFTIKAKECQSLQTQITSLDKEIDQMVYKLYGLTQEEIEVVEG